MKYTSGGISGKTGQALSLEVPIVGTPEKKAPQEEKKANGGSGASGLAADPKSGGGGASKSDAPKSDTPKPETPKEQPKSTVREGYDLLPEDMKARYLKMSFTLDGEQIDIVQEHLIYQNLSLKEKSRFNEPCKDAIASLVTRLQKEEKEWLETNIGATLATGKPAFVMHAMCGKGSPEQMQAVLKIAGHCRAKLAHHWIEKGSMSESLKAFYQHNMGLDCSGFAGNYARALGTKLEPDTPIPAFAPTNRRRHKVEEILPGDVIIWNPGHIATIQGKRDDGYFDIVESNGEPEVQGLGNTVREIKEAGGDTFHIRKVPFSGKDPEPVWVATLK